MVDSKGKYVVSKGRLRDGEDISQSTDANGKFFIRDAIALAKATDAGDPTDRISYPWLNKGESSPRTKAAGLSYVPEPDWVIGCSACYDDFRGEGALGVARNTIIIVLILAVVIGAAAALSFAGGSQRRCSRWRKPGTGLRKGTSPRRSRMSRRAMRSRISA